MNFPVLHNGRKRGADSSPRRVLDVQSSEAPTTCCPKPGGQWQDFVILGQNLALQTQISSGGDLYSSGCCQPPQDGWTRGKKRKDLQAHRPQPAPPTPLSDLPTPGQPAERPAALCRGCFSAPQRTCEAHRRNPSCTPPAAPPARSQRAHPYPSSSPDHHDMASCSFSALGCTAFSSCTICSSRRSSIRTTALCEKRVRQRAPTPPPRRLPPTSGGSNARAQRAAHLLPVRLLALLALLPRVPQPDLAALEVAGVAPPPSAAAPVPPAAGGGSGRAAIAAAAPTPAPIAALLVAHGRRHPTAPGAARLLRHLTSGSRRPRPHRPARVRVPGRPDSAPSGTRRCALRAALIPWQTECRPDPRRTPGSTARFHAGKWFEVEGGQI